MQATFHCGVCGREAGRVRLSVPGQPLTASERPASQALAEVDRMARPPDQAALVVETFYGVESHAVFVERMKRLIKDIRAADAKALYGISYAYAPSTVRSVPASIVAAIRTGSTSRMSTTAGSTDDVRAGTFTFLMC